MCRRPSGPAACCWAAARTKAACRSAAAAPPPSRMQSVAACPIGRTGRHLSHCSREGPEESTDCVRVRFPRYARPCRAAPSSRRSTRGGIARPVVCRRLEGASRPSRPVGRYRVRWLGGYRVRRLGLGLGGSEVRFRRLGLPRQSAPPHRAAGARRAACPRAVRAPG